MVIRLVLLICLFFLLLGCFLIFFRNAVSYIGLFFVILAMSIPALFFVPNISADLYRYFQEMNIVSQFNNINSLLYAYKYVNNLNYHSFTFLYDLFQWFISRTNYYSILPFLSLFITYICLLFPMIHLRNRGYISSSYIFLGFFLLIILLPYGNVISTVRFFIATGLFFIITFFYYNCSYINRFFVLLLYVILIFIHESMILPLVIMIICTFFKKKIKLMNVFVYIVLFIIIFAYLINSGESSFRGSISNIVSNYTISNFTIPSIFTVSGLNFVVAFIVSYLYGIGSFILINKNKNSINLTSEYNAFILFLISNLLLMPHLIIAQRYSIFLGFLSFLILTKVKECKGNVSSIVKILFYIALFIGILNYLLQFYYMRYNFNFIKVIQYVN